MRNHELHRAGAESAYTIEYDQIVHALVRCMPYNADQLKIGKQAQVK